MNERSIPHVITACALTACSSGSPMAAPEARVLPAAAAVSPAVPAASTCVRIPPSVPNELAAALTGRRLTAKLRMTLTPAGEIGNVRVIESSGHAAFDLWATGAGAAVWRCSPSLRTTNVEVEFTLSFMSQ